MGLNILTALLRGEDGRSSFPDTSAAGVCASCCSACPHLPQFLWKTGLHLSFHCIYYLQAD